MIFNILVSFYILILNSLLIFKLIKNKKKIFILEFLAIFYSIIIFNFLNNVPDFSFNKLEFFQFLYLSLIISIIFILYLHLKFLFSNKLKTNNNISINDFVNLIDLFVLFIITNLIVVFIIELNNETYDKYIVSVILLYLISNLNANLLAILVLLIYAIISNLNLKNILLYNINKELNILLNNKNKFIIMNKLLDIEFQHILLIDKDVFYRLNTNLNVKFINLEIINKSKFFYIFNDNINLNLNISSIDTALNNIPYGFIPLNKLNFKPLSDYIDLLNEDLDCKIDNIISILKIENY